jgi:hypothetical protein
MWFCCCGCDVSGCSLGLADFSGVLRAKREIVVVLSAQSWESWRRLYTTALLFSGRELLTCPRQFLAHSKSSSSIV